MNSLGTLEEIMDIGETLCAEYSKRIDETKEGTSIEAFKENLESIRTIQQQRELSLRETVKRLTGTLGRLEDETKRLKDENGASVGKAINDLVSSKEAAFAKLGGQISRRKDIFSSWESGKGGGAAVDDDMLFELETTINNLETVLYPSVYKKLNFLVTVTKIIFKSETLTGTGMQVSGCKKKTDKNNNVSFLFSLFFKDSFCGCENSGELKPFSFNSAGTSAVEKADYLWSLIE